VGVDTLGPVVRGCLKATFRNLTRKAWWVRVRYALILTQFPRVLVSVTLSVCRQRDGSGPNSSYYLKPSTRLGLREYLRDIIVTEKNIAIYNVCASTFSRSRKIVKSDY